MKTLITIVLIALIPLSIFSQSDAIDDFYYSHGLADNMLKFNIGNSLIRMGSWFIEEPATKNLVRKSKRARILLSDGEHPVTRREIDRLVREISHDGYESLALVRDGLQKIEVYVREDKSYIRNLLVVVHGDDEFLMASLDCKFTMGEVEAAFNEEL